MKNNSIRRIALAVLVAPLVALTFATTAGAVTKCRAQAQGKVVYTDGQKYEVRFKVTHDAPEYAQGAVRYAVEYVKANDDFRTNATGIINFSRLRSGEFVNQAGMATFDIGQVLYVDIKEVSCIYF